MIDELALGLVIIQVVRTSQLHSANPGWKHDHVKSADVELFVFNMAFSVVSNAVCVHVYCK